MTVDNLCGERGLYLSTTTAQFRDMSPATSRIGFDVYKLLI